MSLRVDRVRYQSEPEKVYTAEEIANFLSDLYRVGPEKPLGYLPLNTLEVICGVGRAEMIALLESKRLQVILFTNQSETNVWSGALYAYDAEALARVLNEGRQTLEQNGWPTEPDPFVRYLYVTATDPDLYRLIMVAFSDPRLTQVDE